MANAGFLFVAHTAKTLSLSDEWDLELTPEGNLKMLRDDSAILQDVANELRLWRGDAYFQQENGISWREVQLGERLSPAVITNVIRETALMVDSVSAVSGVELEETDAENRVLHGQITLILENGNSGSVSF